MGRRRPRQNAGPPVTGLGSYTSHAAGMERLLLTLGALASLLLAAGIATR